MQSTTRIMKWSLIIVAVFLSQISNAQTGDINLFKLVCQELKLMDERVPTKKQFDVLELVYDIKTNEPFIWHNEALSAETKRLMAKYTSEQLIELLGTPELKIFPLSDTLFIIDSSSYFKSTGFTERGTHFTVKKSCPSQSQKCIYFDKAENRKTEIVLPFYFPEEDYIYNFYFKKEGAKLRFSKVDMKYWLKK